MTALAAILGASLGVLLMAIVRTGARKPPRHLRLVAKHLDETTRGQK